jgi:sec-independent protein translocase protein TatA
MTARRRFGERGRGEPRSSAGGLSNTLRRSAIQETEEPHMFEGLFQPLHLIVVLAVVLVVFGPGRLPELGESLGRSIRGFKKALEESDSAPRDESSRDDPK